MEIKKVMVLGPGQMGGGIAQVTASAGIKTYLYGRNMTKVKNKIEFIDGLLTKNINKGRITEEQKTEALNNIIPTDSLTDAEDCDLVIEALAETLDLKSAVFTELDRITKDSCIFATNTSSLPITEIAAFTKRPEKVIGMHFMNPVPVMKLIEIIRGLGTSDETYKIIEELSYKLGKTPAEVKDVPGFISNRVLQVMINEAIFCLNEGVASPKDIDTVMKLGMNHPMGPLELADFIGLDTVLSILEILHDGYGDPKYRPCPLLRQYVKAGWLGKKVGKGFYNYE